MSAGDRVRWRSEASQTRAARPWYSVLMRSMRSRWRYLVLAWWGCPLVASCNNDPVCTLEARAGLTITVLDARGTRVCDAVVTAHELTFSERLMVLGDASNCTYSGVYERPGIYCVEVIAGSVGVSLSDRVVSPGECHVNGVVETIMLPADASTSDGGADPGDSSADR